MTREFNDTNFESEVLNSDQPVLVDFWAPWCGPCRALTPTIDALAADNSGAARIGKINVDENPEMAATYGISSIPAVLVFKDGEVAETLIGVQPRESYQRALSAASA